MRKIFKYQTDDPSGVIRVPKFADFLHANLQSGKLTIWFLVNPENEKESRWFGILPTGADVSCVDNDIINYTDTKYCGTIFDEPFVWHIFEFFGVTYK